MMTLDGLLNEMTDALGGKILKVYKHSAKRAYVDIYPKDIRETANFLLKDLALRFNIASAVDNLDNIEILYHFSSDKDDFVVSVRAMISEKSDPHIDTITDITKSAWWIEREIHELFGVEFDGNDDLRPLLLPDDWPRGVYPLRKDFIAPKRDSRKA